MTEPFHAPPLQKGTALLWNALASRLLPAAVTLDNGLDPGSVVQITCPVHSIDMPDNVPFTLYVNMNGFWRLEFGNLDIFSLRPELAEWLAADVSNRFTILPDPLKRAVLERLFLPLLDNISRYSGLPAIFVGPPRSAARPMFSEHLDVLIQVQGVKAQTTPLRIAWQDTATLMPILDRLEALPLHQLPPAIKLSGVSANLVIGSMRLTPEELASLTTGDVLLPLSLFLHTPRLCLAQNLYLACDLDGNTLTVRSQETSFLCCDFGEKSMSDNVTENPAQPAGEKAESETPVLEPANLEKIELDITFELPGLRFPLAECARLTPGYTFLLNGDAATLPVTVRAGGHAVARGRLVEVAETMGVQITQLVKTPSVEDTAKDTD
ncbi:MAG: type III secretion system cytoplasmic ring protein SctQ [Desulfovibrio sp.]|nr:type III secretion system cytoplasmic ring protein SctQ [Desulfovibrio sp.]